MIIDIHTHCFPEEVASKSISARSQKFGIEAKTDGTIAGLKQSMSKAGVDLSVLQPIAMKPQQTIKMNRWAARAKYAGIISFGTIHPDFPDWKQELKWLVAKGFKGIKFHSDCQGYFVDNPHMLKMYEEVFNAGLIILFHSGVDTAFKEPYHCTPSRLRKVIDTFPGASMVAAHMGGYRFWDDVEKYLLGSNIYLDTAYSIHELGKERSERFIKKHGAEKILYGTDSPWRDQAADISLIRSLDLNKKDIDAILGYNAKKLLNIGS
jgi:uncharacterized protein